MKTPVTKATTRLTHILKANRLDGRSGAGA